MPANRASAFRASGFRESGFRERQRARGFTLIELVVTIVVTAIALTGLGVGLITASRNSLDPVISMRAATLAQAYLDEILSKRFDEQNGLGGVTRCNETGQPPCSVLMGADAGEARATYDDVDDYNGLNESPPRDAFGNNQNLYDGFRVQVSVNYDAGFNSGFGVAQAAIKKITLRINGPLGGEFTFAAYRGNF